MSKSYSDSYKAAGVDVVAGYESVELIKKHIKKTQIKGVLGAVGGFDDFELDMAKYKNPVLVSGTDGVGTKLKLAFLQDKHDTIGIDCVAMCVNDIVCYGANPVIFLDYIAVSKNIPTKIEQIVSGVAKGCLMAGCALVGGETAEMPGFYSDDEYDIAGFSVGVVEKDKIIDKSLLKEGDKLIGLASSGVHSNGYSLVRKVFDMTPKSMSRYIDACGATLGEELLKPTRIYVKPILALIDAVQVKAVCHVTGGGFYENIPRMMKDGFRAQVKKGSFPVSAIFDEIMHAGNIPERDMYNTFNMGIGMIVAVSAEDEQKALDALALSGEKAYTIGEIIKGDDKFIMV